MRYNKNISLAGNIFLLNNKIKNEVEDFKGSENMPSIFIPKNMNNKPWISFVIMGEGSSAYNSLINQSYINITVNKFENFDFDNISTDYICFVNSTDMYYNNAAYNMAEILEENDFDGAYSDEDLYGEHFYKPDWSPDTLKSFNYIGNLLIKSEYVYKFENYYDFLREIADKNLNIHHISKTLYKSDRYIDVNEIVPKEDKGKVSIIIPSKDNYDVVKRCVESIREKTKYDDYEIIIVDNGSENKNKYKSLCDKYVYDIYEFNFSKMCNIGAENAKGDYLLFLNDDTEVISEDWLNKMVSYANEKNMGAVGAKLYYPDSDIIQHCGVVNLLSGPVHYFAGFSDSDILYYGKNRFVHNVSAVTAACMMIKKDRFFGFDEEFAVGYNDCDLCFSLIEKGYRNVVLNDCLLYHYESLSRGDDRCNFEKLKRLALEKDRLYNKHKDFCCNDKYYNVNLSLLRADYSYDKSEIEIPKKYIEKKFSPIEAVIDYNFVRDDILYIGGFVNKKGIYRYFIEIEEDEKYIANANINVRMDKAVVLGKGYSLSGFSGKIDISRFKNNYKLSLIAVNIFGKTYKMSF
ncbi:MAG: glycosyltransferase [Lachnospirales bacterium]